jgi:hypothetical protein
MATDIKKRIERLEKQLADLKEKEKKGRLYVKQPEFENAIFFVEDGFANVKQFMGNPRRQLATRIDGSQFVSTNSGHRFGTYPVLAEEFNVDKLEQCCNELVAWIKAERLKEE